MTELKPFLTREKIQGLVSDMAERISSDYQDEPLVLIGVLKGSFIFLSDLVRALTIPVEIDFVGASSYGADFQSSEQIRLTKQLQIDIHQKNILVVEDIIDTGLTLSYLLDYMASFRPNRLSICALIDKRELRKADIDIDYVGQVVDKGFLVGYGLDYAEKYRNLPDMYFLKI